MRFCSVAKQVEKIADPSTRRMRYIAAPALSIVDGVSTARNRTEHPALMERQRVQCPDVQLAVAVHFLLQRPSTFNAVACLFMCIRSRVGGGPPLPLSCLRRPSAPPLTDASDHLAIAIAFINGVYKFSVGISHYGFRSSYNRSRLGRIPAAS